MPSGSCRWVITCATLGTGLEAPHPMWAVITYLQRAVRKVVLTS
jgi:hypothetical protein